MTKQQSENDFIIPVDDLFYDFEDHLNIKNNARIFFSGKYGIGKTFFLKEYFKKKENEFDVYHLFPINYQISSNENIVDFIKYDILVELQKKNKEILEENEYKNFIDLRKLIFLWGKGNSFKIFKTIISLIPRLGRPMEDIITLIEKILEYKKEIEGSEKEIIESFLEEIKQTKNIETDPMSELLKKKVEQQKGEKESILILDDLDRVDPEHIFRLINMFFAYLATSNEEYSNKFNFDKIILVADIQNLKSIFHHKYGIQADFNGYFDKYFSVEIFQFKNEHIIKNAVSQIISEFQIDDTKNLAGSLTQNGFLRIFLEDILINSLDITGKEKLNLRELLKGIKHPLPSFKKGRYREGFLTGRDHAVPKLIDTGINTLISIFGGLKGNVISVLEKIKSNAYLKEEAINDDKTNIYREFSKYILKGLKPFDGKIVNSRYKWNNYSIEINNGEIDKVYIEDQETKIEYLYIDLLIKYIQTKWADKF